MSAYQHLKDFKEYLEQREADGKPIYIQKSDGKYDYHPEVQAEFARVCVVMNSEHVPTEKYSVAQIKTLKNYVKHLLAFGFVKTKGLKGTEAAKEEKQNRDKSALLIRYFGGKNIDNMSDQEFVNIYDAMINETQTYSRLNSVLVGKVQDDPIYQQEQGEIEAEKNRKNIFQKIAANKFVQAVFINRIKTLFIAKDSPLMLQSKGLKPVSKATQLENINRLIKAFENLPYMGPQTIQAKRPTRPTPTPTPVPPRPIPVPPRPTPTPTPTPSGKTSTSDGITVDYDMTPRWEYDVVYETPKPEPTPEPEKPKTTTVRKTVSYVKPITLEEIVDDPSKFAGDYPSLTYIDDSNKEKIPRGYNHEGEIAVGRDEKGRPIVVSVYQKQGSNQLYYGNTRIHGRVTFHERVQRDLDAGRSFGEIKVGRKKDVVFRYQINEDGSVRFVPPELVTQFENGTATRKVEEYVEEEVVVEVPFDGDVLETQEKGAPVALHESDKDFNPPHGITPKTVKVKSGDDLYGSLRTYEYYEDPRHKGTFLIREIPGSETAATMVDQAEWDSTPTRLVLHSDAYDQDFNFDPSSEPGLLKNVDHIVQQEKIDAERRRQDELTLQQEEELRIQREQAEIDRKKDFRHNGPDPELYDFGDKQYPVFRHPQRQDELHRHTKLSTIIPVGVTEVTMPDGTTQQRVVAVEVWRSKDNPNEYFIGEEVVISHSPERFKEELAWTDGVSPVIDINNHKGHHDREPVPVVIGRDSSGKLTIVSAEFIQDYKAGKIKNKFSERVSGEPEPTPDITAEMPDAYIYSRLHADEFMKYYKAKKGKDMMAEMEAFYESKGSPKREVDNFRKTANNEAEVSNIIDNNKVAAKEFAKFKKRHKDLSDQEARIEFMMEYQREMRQANEKGKLDKFIKKYAKGQKTPFKTPLETAREIVEEQDPRPIGKDGIVAEAVLTEDQQREIDGHLREDVDVVYEGETTPTGVETSTGGGAGGDTTTGAGGETTTVFEDSTTTTMDYDYNNPGSAWTNDGSGVTFTYDFEDDKPKPGKVDEAVSAGAGGDPVTGGEKPGERGFDDPFDMFGLPKTQPEFEPIVPETPVSGGAEFEPIVPGEESPKPPQPATPVSGGQVQLPSGIDNMAADCLWKDILETVGPMQKADGTPYIGSNVKKILELAASDGSKQADPALEKKMIEIILESYKNARLRELLESKGLSKLPEGKEGQTLMDEAKKLAIQDFNNLGWEQFSIRGKARLTLFELSKGKFNPNNGKELEDGQIPDDHRRDSFFYRALCKSGIEFDLGNYREKVKGMLESQLAGEEVLTKPDNVNFDPNNIDPSKFTEVIVIGEDGKPMKAHKITINGKEVYVTPDHKSVLEISDVTASKTSGKFGEISIDDVNDKVRESRPKTATGAKGMSGVTQQQRDDARGSGDGRTEMGGW